MQNRIWGALVLLLLITGCSKDETGMTQRQILKEYKDLNIRLDRLSTPLLSGNYDLCDDTRNDDGIRWHQFSDYPEEFRLVSQSFWGVSDEPSVFYVLAGSVADKAGVKSGDQPTPELRNEWDVDNPICNISVLVSYTDEINAFATGTEIIVTSGMLRAIDDEPYMSLVIAHELSHNILKHNLKTDSGDYETEADRAAVILMARAGLDYQTAIRNRERVRAKLIEGGELSKDELDRIAYFKQVSIEISALQAAGKPVWP